jgi:adenine-specific DNA-methyltransferase
MKFEEKSPSQSLVEYADRLADIYTKKYDLIQRKIKGQFFTPKQVSLFMADLLFIKKDRIRLLDPGAGIGILTAAFCERILDFKKKIKLSIDVYENDPNILNYLKSTLQTCKYELEKKGHSVEYKIYEDDFILSNKDSLEKSNLFVDSKENKYDYVISNPPYYKLNRNSPQAIVMTELINGQTNIYPLFMALASQKIKPDGEMVFITPRSFCSGLYYKRFIKWFLDKMFITNIHIFHSRKEIFDKDKILQENIIIKAKRQKEAKEGTSITISSSKNKSLAEIKKIKANYSDIISRGKREIFIRIPTSKTDLEVLKIVDSWQKTFNESGLEISTGPIVPFRAEQYLIPEIRDLSESAPLLWMHNLKDTKAIWPLDKKKKAPAIRKCEETMPLLLPVKNYVLVKRFSSKEQKRRLYAAAFLETEFPYDSIGFENHINYIHKPKSKLSVYETLGITSILNTKLIDNYFRSLNGNTQVNATDIRHMPFPEIDKVKEIGKTISETRDYNNGIGLDMIIADILGLNKMIIKKLYRGDIKNEQNY